MARKIINKNKKNSIRKQDDNQKKKTTPKTAPTQKYNKNTNKNTNKNINKIPVMNWFLTDNNTHDQSTQNHYKDVHKPRPSQTVSFLNIARGENQPLKE